MWPSLARCAPAARRAVRRVGQPASQSGRLAHSLAATRLTPALGAELRGVDLTVPDLGAADLDAIHAALCTHEVVFLRGQSLDPASHLRLARGLGEVEPPHPAYPSADGHPEIVELANGPHNPPNADTWHTDVTFKAEPAVASLLSCVLAPPLGGDTLWASMTAAWDALPRGIQSEIEGRRAIHDMSDWANDYTVGEADGHAERLMEARGRFGNAIHPMVKTHPVTQRKMLFCNPGFTAHIVGMSSTDSRRLLAYLFDHVVQPQFQVRHRWAEGDVAIWDNRSTMHYAVADYMPHRRTMHRVTLTSDHRA